MSREIQSDSRPQIGMLGLICCSMLPSLDPVGFPNATADVSGRFSEGAFLSRSLRGGFAPFLKRHLSEEGPYQIADLMLRMFRHLARSGAPSEKISLRDSGDLIVWLDFLISRAPAQLQGRGHGWSDEFVWFSFVTGLVGLL